VFENPLLQLLGSFLIRPGTFAGYISWSGL
jgi:hypothetical protein